MIFTGSTRHGGRHDYFLCQIQALLGLELPPSNESLYPEFLIYPRVATPWLPCEMNAAVLGYDSADTRLMSSIGSQRTSVEKASMLRPGLSSLIVSIGSERRVV